jgi:hypothetical protein
MQPSWTFPIPQAMQQHRGSQLQRAAIEKLSIEVAPTDDAKQLATAPSLNIAKTREDEPREL